MTKNLNKVALNLLKRDWSYGELRVVLLAIIVAVTSITTIGFFIERVQRSIERQSADFLGADRVIRAGQAIADEWEEKAHALGLKTAHGVNMASVVVANDNFQLSRINAVSDAYPLRGRIKVAPEPFAEGEVQSKPPKPGEAWVEARLLSLLQMRVGDNLDIGEGRFKVTGVVLDEPGKAAEFFNVAPHVLINLADVPGTDLIQPGSRVSYRLYLAGEESALAAFDDWIQSVKKTSQQYLGAKDSNQALGNAFDRADSFLHLAALLSVVLAGIAIGTASNRYAVRHYDYSAILRCLGASERDVLQIYLRALLVLTFVASFLGGALGFILHFVLFTLLADFFPIKLSVFFVRPAVVGVLSGCVILLGFALPNLIRLKQVSPLRVLRRELQPIPVSGWLIYSSAIFAMALLMLWYTRSLTLVGVLISSGGVVIVLSLLLSLRALSVMNLLKSRLSGSRLFGLKQLLRFRKSNAIQVASLGFALLVMMVILHIRTDLIAQWESKLPDNAPNYFLVNIQPQQVDKITTLFKSYDLKDETIYPMIRGRLSALNGIAAEEAFAGEMQNHNALRRELNLSMTQVLSATNTVVEGQWLGEKETGISIEQGLSRRLNLSLGDELTFNIAGASITREITSIRKVEWDSFKPNFYVIFPEDDLSRFSKSFITSVYVPSDKSALLNDIIRQFPTVTIIELEPIMLRVKSVLAQVTLAIEFILSFVLLAGIVVLMSTLQATMDERKQNTIVTRTLGAQRTFIVQSLRFEFSVIGCLAGLLAALGTQFVGLSLSYWVFKMDAQWHPWLWVLGPAVAIVIVNVAGGYMMRNIVTQSPLPVLREMT